MSTLGTVKSAINLAGNITNILTNATIKDFYSIRDFYNFIRKQQNCPMQHKNFFTVVPEIPIPGIANMFSGKSFSETLSNIWGGIKNSFSQR